MIEMEKQTVDVLIRLTIESLRTGYPLSESESSALDRLPAIDGLRRAIEPRDLKWLLPLIQSAPDATAGFACSLSRHLIDECGVAGTMIERWEVASAYLKNRIMWRLLEYKDLPGFWSERFLHFVLENREVFDEFNRRFFGVSEDGLGRIQSRTRNESFPERKKWIYWLCVPSVVLDGPRCKGLLGEGLLKGDDFARRAIRTYQEKFRESLEAS
jgi:hypothetical protein